MPVAAPTTRTTSERVYELLRADIHAGRLAPGSRLRYVELRERYGASAGVMRGVMLRLREQGLLDGELNHGFRVIELSIEDLQDLTASRLVLESLALRHAIAEGDVDWESRLLAAHHRLSRCPMREEDDPDVLGDRWVAEHAEFHRALLDGGRNRRLKEVASSLREAAELYRRWSLPLGGDAVGRDVPGEHEALLDAVLARDAERAVELLTAHLTTTTRHLLDGHRTATTVAPPTRGPRGIGDVAGEVA